MLVVAFSIIFILFYLYRALCDTKDCGKLSKDQFALAFHLINQKLIKGIDPPHVLTPEMIPPSDRTSLQKVRQNKRKPECINKKEQMLCQMTDYIGTE